MQQSQCFGETLNGKFFQMMGSDTRAMGRFVDVVRGNFSVSKSIGYVSYLVSYRLRLAAVFRVVTKGIGTKMCPS